MGSTAHSMTTHASSILSYVYNKLWKAIIQRDEAGMAEAARALGVSSDFKLFSGMVTSKTYENIMDSAATEKRLGRPQSQEELDLLK